MKYSKKTLFILFAFLITTAFFLNGCLENDSPSAAVKKAFAVAEEANYKTSNWTEFDKYSVYDPNTLHLPSQKVITMQNFFLTYGKFKKIISETIDGDKATVKATFEKGNDYDIKLIKHEGRWKILFY
jgi:PBP1b-binding outer membrane lipoprotein LpoB